MAPIAVLEGHTAAVHSVSFSHDSTVLTSGSSDCTVRTWDISAVLNCNHSRKSSAVDQRSGASSVSGISVLTPHTTLYTKKTPVYSIGTFSDISGKSPHLVYAGGPFMSSF